MSSSERGLIFGVDAVAYDAARPGYPTAAIDRILSLTDVASAVEVGAGTGKATIGFAQRGVALICLEPSPQMAAILRGKGLTGVEVVVSSFEDFLSPEPVVDLVFAAQAWHWVERDTGYRRARSILRPGGVLALMWNIPQDRYAQFRDVYERHAPEILAEQDERIRRRDSQGWLSEMAGAGFEDVELFSHRWSTALTAPELCELRATYSDHMMLPERRRRLLLDDLASRVEESGASVVVDYVTHVFTGRN